MDKFREEMTTEKYVIIVWRNGERKYLGRRYSPKYDIGYTVKLNGAMMFNTPEAAYKTMEFFGLSGSVAKVEKRLRITEVM